MELIKDIQFCSKAGKEFKLDLCLPANTDSLAVRKHIKFKSAKLKNNEPGAKLSYHGKPRGFSKNDTEIAPAAVELTDSDVEIDEKQGTYSAVYSRSKGQSEETDKLIQTRKAPFVIFVHGGGWRRGGRQAWKHYLYHDVNFLVAVLQWLLNVHHNVGISLAQCGIGCALISYPLTEQDMPYVCFEMFLSYIQSCFITFLGLSPLWLFIYLFQVHEPNHISWFHVFNGNRYGSGLHNNGLIVCLVTNMITLLIFTLRKEKFKLSSVYLTVIWFLFILAYLLVNFLFLEYELVMLTLLTLILTQSVILHRRLSRTNVSFSDQVKVVAHAVQWGKRLARKTGQFDSEELYLMGHSAGGHLITLTVLDDAYLKQVRCSSQDIKGVIALAGVYDLDCLNTKILKQTYLVPNFGKHEQTWRKASPYHQVKKSKTTRRPKFLLMNAALDPVLVRQSHAFSEKLTNAGWECKHVTVHGSNHFTIITNLVRIFGENDQSVLKLTVDFIFQN